MKAIYFFLIALFICLCSSKDCEKTNPTSAKDCIGGEVGKDYYKCCYQIIKYTGKNEEKFCNAFTKEQCDDIKKYKEDMKNKIKDLEMIDVVCNSKYLVLSVISLLLFLL